MKKIMVVCGSGLGSSFMVEINIKSILQELVINDIEVSHSDLTSVTNGVADLIIISKDLRSNLATYKGDVLVLNSVIDKKELKTKLIQKLKGVKKC